MAYTPNGDYIGNLKDARFLCETKGIKPEKISPDHNVCSIGFSSIDGKWYGWSHRAIFGFKIGSKCKIGDCHFKPSNKKEFIKNCEKFWSGKMVKTYGSNNITIESPNGSQIKCDYPEKWGNGEWIAETVADARQMACDFAESVS